MHTSKKHNGTESEYSPVSQGLQSDDDDPVKPSQNGDLDSLKNGSLKKKEAEANLEKGKGSPNSEEIVPMTPIRKVCFVLSILQCGLFIVAFGYLIPCQIPRYYDNSVQTWSYQLKDNDISTNIELVTVDKKQSLILFGFQSPYNSSYGLKAIDALSGVVKWEVPPSMLPGSPVAIVCNTQFKMTPEDPPSCLVTDSLGKLLSLNVQIDPVSPRSRLDWFMHIHGGSSSKNTSNSISIPGPGSISAPIVLDDCDGDGVNDVVVTGLTSENQAILYVVSGVDGTITNTVRMNTCSVLPSLLAWEENKDWKVIVNCADKNGFENVWAIPKHQLCYNNITDSNLANLDVDQIHSLGAGDSLSRVVTIRNNDANNYLILVSKKGHIVGAPFSGIPWDISLPADAIFKDVTGGSFVNVSQESVAILYAEPNGSSVILLLAVETGSLQRNISYNESRATFLYAAINNLDEPDTLLIKNIQGSFNDTDTAATLVDELVALECKENASFVTVWKAPTAVQCSGLSCVDVVHNRSAVVIGDFNSSGKQLAIVAYHISVPEEGSGTTVGTQIELNRLYDALPSKCKACGC